MQYMVMLILNDPDNCPCIIDAWDEAGAPGITVLESVGTSNEKSGLRDNVPLLPSIRDLMQSTEHHHRTLFSVVEGEEVVDRLIDATCQLIGNLEELENGFLFVVPVYKSVGLSSGSCTPAVSSDPPLWKTN